MAAVEGTLAYHFGERVLAEVDVVLPPSLPLEAAHDVGQKLQVRLGGSSWIGCCNHKLNDPAFYPHEQDQIEGLEEVERGFVHLDYSLANRDEHRIKD